MSIKTFSAVVFDMDGTLFDTERLSREVWQEVGAELGEDRPGREHRSYTGMNRAAIFEEMLRRYGPDFPAMTFLDRSAARFQQRIETEGVPMKPGVREVLDLLEGRGVPAAMATSTQRDKALDRLERAGLSGRFRVVIAGDQVAHSKPHPEIWLTACAALGVAPETALAVEDSTNGVRSALAAGMPTVLIPDGWTSDLELEARLYRRFDSLTELARALEDILPPPVGGSLPRRRLE